MDYINAKIESTMLGIEDHGIMTFMIYVDTGSYHIGFGGYALDEYSEEEKTRVGSKIGMEFISRILDVVGVGKWEDLKGKHIRLCVEGKNGGTKVMGIGNIIEDNWFYPKEYFEEFGKKS